MPSCALHGAAETHLHGLKHEVLAAAEVVARAHERGPVDPDGLLDEGCVALERAGCLLEHLAVIPHSLQNEGPVVAELARHKLDRRAAAWPEGCINEVTVCQDLFWGVGKLRPVCQDHGTPAGMAVALEAHGRRARLVILGLRIYVVLLRGLEDGIHEDGDSSEAGLVRSGVFLLLVGSEDAGQCLVFLLGQIVGQLEVLDELVGSPPLDQERSLGGSEERKARNLHDVGGNQKLEHEILVAVDVGDIPF
mmetsp:Transcript_34329/g.77579  ORF Transcript_34329/g.77579 Transcript_34329/m.77579 type:complete len:250 (+) Transcript_34329:1350-2099(+)